MDIRYIVQEGIFSPRENAYVYRDVAEVMNDRAEARRIALTYPAARVLKCTIMHEHGSRTGPEGRVVIAPVHSTSPLTPCTCTPVSQRKPLMSGSPRSASVLPNG